MTLTGLIAEPQHFSLLGLKDAGLAGIVGLNDVGRNCTVGLRGALGARISGALGGDRSRIGDAGASSSSSTSTASGWSVV